MDHGRAPREKRPASSSPRQSARSRACKVADDPLCRSLLRLPATLARIASGRGQINFSTSPASCRDQASVSMSMSVTRLATSADAAPGVPLRRALLYVAVLLGSNLTSFLIASSYSSCAPPPAVPRAASPVTATTVREQLELPPEFHAFAGPHALPYGRNPYWGTAELRPPVGNPCLAFPDLLAAFLSYPVNGSCPDDELSAQRLMLRGCEPLPRRRCRPAAPRDPAPPLPFPDALWSTPPDRSIHWSAYTCKSFRCLVERYRWLNATGKRNPLDFSVDEVLASASPPGSVRIGLDIGGGSGTFAVRMRERGVTVVATTVNLNGPFSAFVAARGIVPLYVSVAARLPFFDNTLDIVHSMHVLSGWIPTAALQFALFDVYRVLRPGGLFWLDHFFCREAEMPAYVEVLESVGFRKMRWVTGRKLDKTGAERKEKYLSALLEKPLQNSWIDAEKEASAKMSLPDEDDDNMN